MSDTDGQYPAIIRAMNLNGIQTFSVLDPYAHPKPKGIKPKIQHLYFLSKAIYCFSHNYYTSEKKLNFFTNIFFKLYR